VVGTIARTLGGPKEGVEDVSQDVFYRLIKFCDFSAFPNGQAFLGYLHAICRNVARDFARKSGGEEASSVGLDEIPSKGEEQRLSDERLHLRKIFSALDPEELLLAEFLLKGYTLKEIAHLTEQTYGGLAVRIHRLKARLRDFG
jgi:RNA polymerase sigma factor (sigma-70 family)